jgi:hypothetical protein
MSKKVEEIKEKEEVVKEKKPRTKKVKEAEPKEEIKEEKVKRTRTKKVKEEPKEAEEIVEAEKIKDEEKTEIIEMKEEVTALAIFNNDELEILKKVIAEYRARANTNNANTTNSDTEKAKNFFENIEIPNEVRKIEYNTTLSIRGKQEIYDKIKEVAKKNGITASLLVNYLFYLILKPLGEWEEAIKK